MALRFFALKHETLPVITLQRKGSRDATLKSARDTLRPNRPHHVVVSSGVNIMDQARQANTTQLISLAMRRAACFSVPGSADIVEDCEP